LSTLLNGEIFYSSAETKVIIESWRRYYNTERPHSSLEYKPPTTADYHLACAAARIDTAIYPGWPKADHALKLNLDHLRGQARGRIRSLA
jgi:hypothetical protein